MPFTISHAVLAPPLARLSKNKLPIAALAIGCMSPDLIRFFVENDHNSSHQWSSLIDPNLFVGLGFVTLWYLFYRPMLYRFFALHDPIEIPTWRKKIYFFIAILLALLIGTVTHLLWDGFTHADARTLLFYDQLSKDITVFGYVTSVHMLLQLLSSAIPLPIMAYMVYRYAKEHRVKTLLIQRTSILILCIVMLIFGLYEVWSDTHLFTLQRLKIDPYHTVGDGLVNLFKGIWLGLTTSSVVYMLHKKTKQWISS